MNKIDTKIQHPGRIIHFNAIVPYIRTDLLLFLKNLKE
jgi:hypothetical protein